jgi:chemotaxis protein methyltransferase CheR
MADPASGGDAGPGADSPAGDEISGPALRGAELEWFRAFIYREAGIHFKPEKAVMLTARLSRRLRQLGLGSFAEYRHHLQKKDPAGRERGLLINCITTNKTDFFRELHHFDYLRLELFPRLIARARTGGPRRLRIWSAGCSTGEEPYSLAISLREFFPQPGWSLSIVASDIDTQVLATAAAGVYSEDRLQTMTEDLRRRHFQRGRGASAGLWRARPELKQLIDFRRVNLNHDNDGWPTRERFDVIFCRNVIIYFDRPTQIRLFERFARQLEPKGLLFLGHSESLIGISDRYTLIGKTIHALRPAATAARGEAEAASLPPSAPLAARAPVAPRPPVARPVAGRRIVVGQLHASAEPLVIHTLLGSCVAAGLYDPEARVGGMNHFLLAEGDDRDPRVARYGVHAMELLINEIMRLGGQRQRLRAKIFGGANVMASMSSAVSEQNVRFVRHFLEVEGIPLMGERVGGTTGLEVWFDTSTGRARVRPVRVLPATLLAQQDAERVRVTNEMEIAPEGGATVF